MSFETSTAERYFSAPIRFPGFLLQGALDAYLAIVNRFDKGTGRFTTRTPPPTEEIAEKSGELMAVHYDLPLPLFTHFLGPTMKYSTAFWEEGERSLEAAQVSMMDDVCEKAQIEDGQRILDLGCGFGSFCRFLAEAFPHAEIFGLTLSKTQADYIRSRRKRVGHPLGTERFHLLEGDFNAVEFEERFDRVVSIGVFEHVSNLSRALAKIRRFISDDGLCFLHYISYRSQRRDVSPPRQSDFLANFVFPGARIWPHGEIGKHGDSLKLRREWFLNGYNYKRTLEAWLRNFHHDSKVIVEETGLDDRFMKLWDFYLRSCIATFRVDRGRYYGNGQYLLSPV